MTNNELNKMQEIIDGLKNTESTEVKRMKSLMEVTEDSSVKEILSKRLEELESQESGITLEDAKIYMSEMGYTEKDLVRNGISKILNSRRHAMKQKQKAE